LYGVWTMNTREKYRDQGLDPDAEYVAECPVCDEWHEWSLDDGLGGAFGQGWVHCPDYGGGAPVGKDAAVKKTER